ncbi:MAG: DnaJ domain-containing protein [Myxococcota bacterium]
MAEDPNVHPHWARETKRVARGLNRLDYYEVLGAGQEASFDELKRQYHLLQRTYHPDSFFTSPDEDLKAAVLAIAKRVAEAYVVLKDPQKRTQYTAGINSPERAQKLRYTDESEQEKRKANQERTGRTPQGRQLWRKAQDALKRGDTASAVRDLKTALLFEQGNPLFTDAIAELRHRC